MLKSDFFELNDMVVYPLEKHHLEEIYRRF